MELQKKHNAISHRTHRAVAAALAALGLGILAFTTAAAGDDSVASAVDFEAPASTTQPSTPPSAPLVENVAEDGRLKMLVNRSIVLKTRTPYKRVSVAQPEVADVNPIGPQKILLTGKKSGTTQMIVWDDGDHAQVIEIVVSIDLDTLQDQIKTMYPTAAVNVSSANGAIVLRGRAPSLQTAQEMVQIATPYGSNVLNFLEISGGQQVMLQVRFAEVSRSATTNLGLNAFASDGRFKAGINYGPGAATPGGFATGTASIDSSIAIFGAGKIGETAFEAFLDTLRQNDLLRVLAEPNLVTSSGQEANFLAGGQFPIPVPQSGTGGSPVITVEYKEFGVRLAFTPVVLGDGKIRLKLAPEVSDLDFTRSITLEGFVIPTITTRNLTTTVELNDGQTFAVAGLLNNRVQANSSVTPLLGDLPVIGALFRSVRYERDETELVVLITPHLVGALNPGQVPPLPGEHWRYPTENELFWNRDLGGPAADMAHAPSTQPSSESSPRFHGQFGFTPVEQPTSSAAE